MNEENKRENIREEIERANEALKAANLLYENGFPKDAVSKLYYSLLYSIRALLLTKGLEPKSHEGALRLFGLHFVKPGSFEARDSHIFSKLMKYREEADYNPSYTFTRDDFIEFKSEAETVIYKITTHLKEKNYYFPQKT
jgi:uncharacterized protein (UPF0332 family)